MNKFDQIFNELHYLQKSSNQIARNEYSTNIRTLLCQVRETLEALEAKQKIWEAKAESQEAQPEQEHSIQHNDQKLPEKEQSQRIRKVNKQYIVSYPQGECIDANTGKVESWGQAAIDIADDLNNGRSVVHPDNIKVQVIDLC